MATAVPGAPAARTLLTIEQVREQYPEGRFGQIDFEFMDGTATTVAFRPPRLIEFKRFMQEKDSPNVGDVNATINLVAFCCLTHDRAQLDKMMDEQVGFIGVAGEELGRLMKAGVNASKKG